MLIVSFRVLTAGRQLAKSLELQSLNDLGFSKRYVRCLQVYANAFMDMISDLRNNLQLYVCISFYLRFILVADLPIFNRSQRLSTA